MRDGCGCVRCAVPLENSWDRFMEAVQCNVCRAGMVVRASAAGDGSWTCDTCNASFSISAAAFTSLTDCCRVVLECMEGAGLFAMVEWSGVLVVWGDADIREGARTRAVSGWSRRKIGESGSMARSTCSPRMCSSS